MSYQNLEIAIEDHVATVTLARTDSMNALSLSFTAEIAKAFRELGANDEVRAIVLASKAKAFCAGLDLKEFAAIGMKGTAKSSLEFPEKLRALFESCDGIEACPKPVIAAVNGMCIGGGLDIVSACDIRLCTEDATFSLREAAIGLVADMGVLQRLPHVIGQGFTREMAFTARFYKAEEAEKMGLVNAVYPDAPAMMEAAIETCPPDRRQRPAGRPGDEGGPQREPTGHNPGRDVACQAQEHGPDALAGSQGGLRFLHGKAQARFQGEVTKNSCQMMQPMLQATSIIVTCNG